MDGSPWAAFCAALARAGEQITRPEAPGDPVTRAEGLRYLTRLLRGGLESCVEFGDPRFPAFYSLSHETLKIGALAETYNVMVAPHNPNGPVGTAASVHAAAVMPNFLVLEYAQSPTRYACQAASEAECFKARDGRIELPTKPGLGIDLDEAYLAAHPYGGVKLWPGLFYADGGVADV